MLINCHVITSAKTEEIEKLPDGSYKIRFNVAPEKGKANKKLVEMLADYFNVAKSNVRIIRGETSKNKVIYIDQVS